MKKRLIGFVLVLTILMTTVMPAFAADAAVQTAYDAYVAMKTALENKDLAALKTATEALEAATEDLDEAQMEELLAMDSEFFDKLLTAAMVEGMSELCDAFLADKNATTAMALVEGYSYLGEEGMEELKALVDEMIDDIAGIYAEAINYMPSDDVVAIYEAYGELQLALMFGLTEELETAVGNLAEGIDKLDTLSNEDVVDLAALLEEDATTVVDKIKADYSNANVILEVAKVYNAFLENASKKTAEAFVAKYDSIYDAEEEGLKEAVSNFFMDIKDVYDEASAWLTDDGNVTTPEQNAEKESEVEKSPQTGDSNVLVVWAMIMMLAGAGVVVAGKKRVSCK